MTSESILSGFSETTDDTFENGELGQRTPRHEDLVPGEEVHDQELTEEPEEPQEPNTSAGHSTSQNQTKEKNAEKSHEPKLTQLPLSRIRNLMKLDPDLQIASAEAAFLIAKATELFIDSLAKESFLYTVQAKKKMIQKRDVDMAVSNVDSLMFLDGAMNF